MGQILLYSMHIKQLYELVLHTSSEELGLTPLEMNIILFLVNHSEYNTARDLCNMRMIPKSNASNGIRLLERKGLLRIERDGENIKLHRLYLTEKAGYYAQYLKEKQQEFLNQIASALDEQEWIKFEEMMKKIDRMAVELQTEYKQLRKEA